MSGPAYPGWAHWRFLGDEAAAKALIPQARKVMGFALQQAKLGELTTNTHTQNLANGGYITAEIYGEQPRITIYMPPQGGESLPVRLLEDFVVWARDQDHPEGIDPVYPQQIIRPSWKTYFFNAGIDGYADFTGKKGTYQTGSGGQMMFPDGVRHAGNVDWRGEDGQRLSWYGPSTRYWVDPFVQTRTQYGKFVFMLGQVVLDVEQYITESDPDAPFAARYVMGAALDGLDLYVIHADLPVGTTTTATQPTGTYMTDPYYPVDPIPHTVCRYRLIPDPVSPMFHKVLNRSREELWSGNLRTGAMPWFFNPQCTHAHCFAVPAGAFGGIDFVSFTTLIGGTRVPPSPSAPVMTFEIQGDAVIPGSVQVSVPPNGQAALAGDYDDDGNQVEVLVRREQRAASIGPGANLYSDHWIMSVGGASFELQELIKDMVGQGFTSTRRYPMFVDARTAFAVVAREVAHVLNTGLTNWDVWIEVYRGGAMVHEQLMVSKTGPGQATGLLREFTQNDLVNSPWKENNVSPMYALYGYLVWGIGVTSGDGYTSRHPGYLVLPYQKPHYYGARKSGGSAGAPFPVSGQCSVTPERERLDFDGKDIVMSAASRPAAALFSGYTFTTGQLDSSFWVSDSTLGELTGVDGDNARYHPLWTLGVPLPST